MKKDIGKTFYELRLKGLNNEQISERFSVKKQLVAVRVLKYRKKNNLPSLKPTKKPKRKSIFIDDDKIRINRLKKAVRRPDGVLECPTMTCEGFGFNDSIYNLQRN